MRYEVEISPVARKALVALPESFSIRIEHLIDALVSNPRPHGCVKLISSDDVWRIRVGSYRILYEVDDTKRIVRIQSVLHRKDAYRKR